MPAGRAVVSGTPVYCGVSRGMRRPVEARTATGRGKAGDFLLGGTVLEHPSRSRLAPVVTVRERRGTVTGV